MDKLIAEYKAQIRLLEHERDLYRLLAIDEVQFNRGVTREEAEEFVNLEIFAHLQGVSS